MVPAGERGGDIRAHMATVAEHYRAMYPDIAEFNDSRGGIMWSGSSGNVGIFLISRRVPGLGIEDKDMDPDAMWVGVSTVGCE